MKQARTRCHARSRQYYEEAKKYIPGGVNSNFRLGMRPFPLFFERASGSKLYDADGNEFIDYALGMGPVILGHAAPAVTEAVKAALARGQLFAGQHEDEVTLAREVCRLVPCAEMVRFGLSGSEAIQAAIRVARALTDRKGVIKFEGHYHGWFDNVYVSVHPDEISLTNNGASETEPCSRGQDPAAYGATTVVPWNDIQAFREQMEQRASEIAAVVMEPIMCNTSVILPHPGYLEAVRELTTRHGIVLIFDEVITGFRVGLGGAQQYLGVIPDLAVLAKAMANGFPMSCLVGRRHIMGLFSDGTAMHGGTYNANTLSCAAASATLRVLGEGNGKAYGRMGDLGSRLVAGLRRVAREAGAQLLVQGLPTVFHTAFTDQQEITDYHSYRRCRLDLQTQFISGLLEQGVRVTDRGTWFLSVAHSEEDIDRSLEAARTVLLEMLA